MCYMRNEKDYKNYEKMRNQKCFNLFDVTGFDYRIYRSSAKLNLNAFISL